MTNIQYLPQINIEHGDNHSISSDLISMVIVEKCALVRSAIHMMVTQFACIGSITEIDCLSRSKAVLNELNSDVIFINLSVSVSIMECLELVEFVKKHYPQLGMIALLNHVTPELVHLLMKKGIHAILDNEATEQDFESAVQASASGNVFLSWHIYEQVLLVDKISQLTTSETQVLGFLMQGYTNHLIAQKLHITIKTVEAHLTRIYQKLNVNSRTQAIVKARELHIFPDSTVTR